MVAGRRSEPWQARWRPARATVAVIACALVATATACESVLSTRAARPELTVFDAAFLPACDALQAAVEDGDEAVARRILASLLARRPPANIVALARAYERILDGRVLVRGLRLRLVSLPAEDPGGGLRLALEASHAEEADLILRVPPSNLRRTLVGMDAGGNQSMGLSTRLAADLSDLRLPAGEVVTVAFLEYELDVGGFLAIRERWDLDLRAGEIELDGRRLPAQGVSVAFAERIAIAGFLPTQAVEPAELLDYVGVEQVYTPALIERAVRIDPSRREEALDLLAPEVARMARSDPERIERIAPALRWLSRSSGQGNQPALWQDWFEQRVESQARGVRLDLPGDEEAR